MCNFKQILAKYQVKDMNVYIEPLIDQLLKLWVGITMYDICKPIGEKKFNFMKHFYGQFMMPWTNTFFGMYKHSNIAL